MKNYFLLFSILLGCCNLSAQSDDPSTVAIKYQQLTDSIQIAYTDEGQGDYTLLFLHGLGSNLKAWQKNITILKKNYRCIALDYPGYGQSTKGDYPFKMSFFAETINEFIDSLQLEKVVLVGHSMGGQIATHAVIKDSIAISKLILIAPAGFELFSATEKQWFQNFYTPAFVKATPEEQIIKNFEINFHQKPDDIQSMVDERLNLMQTPAYDYYCEMIPKCVMGMLEAPVFDDLPSVQIPTLILFGENDALIPNQLLHPKLTTQEVAKSGQQQIAKSQLLLIKAAGHFVQWERLLEVNNAILTFLR